jgi:tRNA dimethylallyltransferase
VSDVRDATRRVPALAAPTATGKTAAALALARALAPEVRLEVVSADAMQVYRGLDVGTAKPGPEERARVPHHVIDVVDPSEAFSVADYVPRAEAAIGEALARGALPLVVGGTGFYLQALAQGLPTTPPADREMQAEIAAELEARGTPALLEELVAASPADAARTQGNPRRVVRAVEVLRRSGRPPSAHPRRPPRFRYGTAVLLPDQATLAARVGERTRALLSAGWLEEVRELMPGMPRWRTAVQAIGYQELRRHLAGECTLDEALRRIEVATLRYAKRQRTWFRRTPRDAARWPGTAEAHLTELEAWLRGFVGGDVAPRG